MKAIQYPGKVGMNGIKMNLFTEDDCRAIDLATRDVLWNYGVQVSDDECIKIFEDAGCIVDYETKMVRIPDFLLNRALASAPKTFYLYGRDDDHTVEQAWNGRVHYTCFGTGIQVCNYLGDGKYETRDSNSEDLATIAKLCDWADGISYFSLPVSARDWAGKGAEDVHEMYISISNTVKHFHHIDPVAEHVKYYWEMLVAFYGGDAKKARDRPLMSMLVCPTSPLELSHNAAQVIKQGAEYGIPVNVLSMAMAGGSSSVHLAGTLVTHNAEILSGIVLAEIVKPGAPVYYGSSTTIFDLKHGTAPVGAPELALISAAVGELGRYYGLPVFTAGMQTDAKVPDSQAAHEKTITSLLPAMAGVNMIYGSGMLELGQTFSLEQLVIDNDIIAMERKALEGIVVNDETLAVPVIKELGVGKDFIGHPTTMANIDLASDPTVFNRDMIGDWRAQGSKACVDVAHEIVVDVLKNHVVAPIDPEIAAKMEAIVKKADEDFLKGKE